MKNLLSISLCVLLFACNSSSQESDYARVWSMNTNQMKPISELFFTVSNQNGPGILPETVHNARKIEDIIEDFPSSWMEHLEELIITLSHNNKTRTYKSKSLEFDAEALAFLKTAELEDMLRIVVRYQKKNAVSGNLNFHEMIRDFELVPLKSCVYQNEDHQGLLDYLKEACYQRFGNEYILASNTPTIHFTVNEKGEVSDAYIAQASTSKEKDQAFLEIVKNMGPWIPATNHKGQAVRRHLRLMMDKNNC